MAHAQAVGAVAAVVLSQEEWLMQMGDDSVNNPIIPSTLLPARDADTLRAALADSPGRLRGALRALTPEQAAAAMSAPGQPGTCLGPASGGVPAGDSHQVSDSTGGVTEVSGGTGDQEQCRWQPEAAAHGVEDGAGGNDEDGNESEEGGDIACGMGEDVVGDGAERRLRREGVDVGGGGVEQGEGMQSGDQQALLSLQEGLQTQVCSCYALALLAFWVEFLCGLTYNVLVIFQISFGTLTYRLCIIYQGVVMRVSVCCAVGARAGAKCCAGGHGVCNSSAAAEAGGGPHTTTGCHLAAGLQPGDTRPAHTCLKSFAGHHVLPCIWKGICGVCLTHGDGSGMLTFCAAQLKRGSGAESCPCCDTAYGIP